MLKEPIRKIHRGQVAKTCDVIEWKLYLGLIAVYRKTAAFCKRNTSESDKPY